MNVTVNISVIPDRLYLIELPAGVSAFYNGTKVGGAGTDNIFVAAENINTMFLESDTQITGDMVLVELVKSYYQMYDGTGGTMCYQPAIDRWTSRYSFRPDWMSMVGNRLVCFKNGMPYVHDGAYNRFFGQTYDSVIASVHNEGGNTVKTYKSVAVEGDTPTRMHFRTEKPYVQSSDLVQGEFDVREGVSYSEVKRDRLSPNASGTYDAKLLKGDPVRGEVCKFMYISTQPSTQKSIKFIDVNFTPSRGQSV